MTQCHAVARRGFTNVVQGMVLDADQKVLLLDQLRADVDLLVRHRLMDYSLLLGVSRFDPFQTLALPAGGCVSADHKEVCDLNGPLARW